MPSIHDPQRLFGAVNCRIARRASSSNIKVDSLRDDVHLVVSASQTFAGERPSFAALANLLDPKADLQSRDRFTPRKNPAVAGSL